MNANLKWVLLGLACLVAAGCFPAVFGLTLIGVLGVFIWPVAAILCIATGISSSESHKTPSTPKASNVHKRTNTVVLRDYGK